MFNEPLLGKNMRDARTSKGWSQSRLAAETGISSTAISAYENDKKRPGLDTLARVANALDVSIDMLYYGDESRAFIGKSGSKGELVVNCFYELWKAGIVDSDSLKVDNAHWKAINLCYDHARTIKRLIETLIEFESRKGTYSSPDVYLEQVFDSVANEIDAPSIYTFGQTVATPPSL